MLIEYLGSFFSPYWGWDVPWEALIKVTETHTLWKHSLFIVAISFCSNTLTHYRAFLYRTIDPFLVSHYRTGWGEINSLKFNTFSPPAWISRKGGGGGGLLPLLFASNWKQNKFQCTSGGGKPSSPSCCAGHFTCLVSGGVCCFCPFFLSGISILWQ